jgi:hypothetical protein
MKIEIILPLVTALAMSVCPSARAGETPMPASAPAEPIAEIKAKAAYDAAEKAAKVAEAEIVPLRAATQKADAAYANARKAANTKRQQATDSKNLAGEPGEKELKQAQANVPDAVKALAEATDAKPAADKALLDARPALLPLQQAYDAAEQLAKEAEAVAKAASDAANKFDIEAKQATAQAAAKRRAAATAKVVLVQAQRSQQRATAQADTAAQKLAEAEMQKKAADEALANAKKQVADAKTTDQPAGGATKDKAGADAAVATAQSPQGEQQAQARVEAAAKALNDATAQKKLADAILANVKNQIATAIAVSTAAETAAQDFAKAAEEKKLAAAQAAAKRKAVADAAAALAQARQGEQQAQTRRDAAAKALSETTAQNKQAEAALANAKDQVAAAKREAAGADQAARAKAQQSEQAAQARATTAAKKLSEAETQKKAADAALAGAKNQVAAATAANQAAREVAKELIELDEASKQPAADAAAKRKEANAAKAALTPAQQKLEQAAIQANAAAQKVTLAEARKKSAEEALANLEKRIAAAKQTYLTDEEAAKVAEAAAAPLKEEADRNRAAYEAAMKITEAEHALVEQAKVELYRLVATRQVANLIDSPDAPKPTNRIDEIVFAKLKALGIKPVLCSDAVFIRRAYLDLTGTLPSAEEAKQFIQSAETTKRVALIERLLDQPAHVDYWAMKWSDILKIKAEFPVKVWPNAAQAYYRWVWESIAQNKPYDRFARELLTSSGSNFRVGPVNFYRAIQDRTPEGIAASMGLALMGARIHVWPEDRRAGTVVFFSQVGYKPTSEWKEEVVFWDPLNSVSVPGSTAPGVDSVAKAVAATNQIPQALDKPLSENGPLTAVFPDGTKTTIPPNRDPREVFADWLIRPENPWFTKAIVDRTWAWIIGRGIIHEPDDIRNDNPPSNPELLAYLQKELVSSGYDLKRLKRLIFTSTTYQFSSIPRFKGREAAANFATYPLRRVEAEVLNDVLNTITGSTDLYTSAVAEPFTYIPKDMNAVEMADGSITSSFLALFGRSARATGMESERVNELASPQWLYMLNSGQVQNKLQSGPKLLAMVTSNGKPKEIAEKLYLTILSRFPTDADVKAAEEYAKSGVTKGRDVWIDLAWALINSPEFLLRH